MGVTTVLLLTFVTLLALLIYILRRRLNYWKDRGIAHDKPHPIFGNFRGVMLERTFGDVTSEIYRNHRGSGPFCGMHFFQNPGVMVLEPALMKQVLIKDFTNFTDRGMFHNEKDDPLTGHLFLLDGEKWRVLRNKLSPTFTSNKMKLMYPTVVQVAERLVDTLRTEMAQSDSVIEIKDLLARFTTDVIGSCAFGIECNSLKDPNAEFRRMGKAIFTDRRYSAVVMGFIEAFPNWARALRLRGLPDHIHNFFMRIVRETVEFRQKNNIQRNDFLNLLIELNKHKSLLDENHELRAMSIEEMAAQVFVFFIGGFQTSSSAMSFCLYELAQHEEIQQRLREEINEVLKRHNNECSYECVREMQYLKQVIAETLRKYPILPYLNRLTLSDYAVPGHPDYVIKKGMMVYIPVMGIHYDPLYYPDPEKFDPARFAPELVQSRDPALWLAFGDGPRNCIGLRFGQMQMRIGLVYLLKNFKFSVCDKTQIPLEMDPKIFITNSKDGIYLKVQTVN